MDIFDEFLALLPSEHSEKVKQQPWICPECKEQFKWDTQLLRHQRKLNHINPDRQARRERRGRKQNPKTVFPCQFCQKIYQTNIQLLNHRPWCLADPCHGQRARAYLSSWNQGQFECLLHEFPFYFSTVQRLQLHISTHKQRHELRQRQIPVKRKTIRRRQRINSSIIEGLKRQFAKYRKINRDQAERIAHSKRISITSVRRHFRRYKANDL